MHHCKKTGRTFNSKRGLLNHLLHEYGDLYTAYENEYDTPVPACKYCSKNAKMKSWYNGFRTLCGDATCLALHRRDSIQNTKRFNESIPDYIAEMVLMFWAGKSKTLEVNERTFTSKHDVKVYLAKLYGLENLHSIIPTISTECIGCGETFSKEMDDPHTACLKNSCRHYRKYDITSEVGKYFTEYGKIKDIDSFNRLCISLDDYMPCDYYILFPEECWSWIRREPLIRKAVNKELYVLLAEHCKPNNKKVYNFYHPFRSMNLMEVVHELFPYVIYQCSICSTSYPLIPARITDSIPAMVVEGKGETEEYTATIKRSTKVCSKTCYHIAKRNPDLYGCSLETRMKQSETTKQSILSGKFTPVNNSFRTKEYSINSNPMISFKSSWELVFYVYMHFIRKIGIAYETYRVKYYSTSEQKHRTYIVDFRSTSGMMYEIKPKELLTSSVNQDKIATLKHNHKVKVITQHHIFCIYKNHPEIKGILEDILEYEDYKRAIRNIENMKL